MQLVEQAPTPTPIVIAGAAYKGGANLKQSRRIWLGISRFSTKVKIAASRGKLTENKASSLQAELLDLQTRAGFLREADGASLTAAQRRELRAGLLGLDLKLNAALPGAKK